MSISEISIRHRVGTTLLAAGLVLVGAVSYFALPVASLPQIDFPTIQISANLPGASADTMAATVATPLETSLSTVSGVTQMTSSSSSGHTTIIMQFDLNRDSTSAAQDVSAAIASASGTLPKGMVPPTYHKVNPAERPM
jgi:multidrug efflux pump